MVRLPHFYHKSVSGGFPELINFKNPSPVAGFLKLLKDPNGNYQLQNDVHHMGNYSGQVLSHTIRKSLNSYNFFQKLKKTEKWPSRPPTF